MVMPNAARTIVYGSQQTLANDPKSSACPTNELKHTLNSILRYAALGGKMGGDFGEGGGGGGGVVLAGCAGTALAYAKFRQVHMEH